MPTVNLERLHHTTLKKAKAASQKIADALHKEFDLTSAWEGDTLNFARPGVSGTLVVTTKAVKIHLEIGMLLGFFATRIENEVRENLEKAFPA